MADYIKPALWNTQSERQIFLGTQLSKQLGRGPALVATADVPDMDYFCNRGAKEIIPLYRDAEATEPNIPHGWLSSLASVLGRETVSAEQLLAYVYALLAHEAYTRKFWDELETCQVRVPLTADASLFNEAVELGQRLLFLHTYAQRMAPPSQMGRIPRGIARNTVAVPAQSGMYPANFEYDQETQTLRVGTGQFAPVSPQVMAFTVSGYDVVSSWIRQRLLEGSGRRSSPLDEIRPESWTADLTRQLLELIWVLESTVAEAPQQESILERVVTGQLIDTTSWPQVADSARLAPIVGDDEGTLFDGIEDV